ncbi:MAG: hypothetical protein ACOY4R_27635 [Pseudomonadota bacterium]
MSDVSMVERLSRAARACSMQGCRRAGPEICSSDCVCTHDGAIAARACLAEIEAMGLVVVPREPTEAMVEAGRLAMPVEYKYWQKSGMLHAEFLPRHECVSPASPWKAMIGAAPGDAK